MESSKWLNSFHGITGRDIFPLGYLIADVVYQL